MNTNTDIAGYYVHGTDDTLCPVCARAMYPEIEDLVGQGEVTILRPAMPNSMTLAKCRRGGCGVTVAHRPIERNVVRRLKVFEDYISTLDF